MKEQEENKSEFQFLKDADPETLFENSRAFQNLMMMYNCAIREIKTKLEVLDDEFSIRYKRNPISSIKSRVKKPVSIYRKLKKNGLEISEENILNGIHDVAGVRVICSFIDDIYTVAALLANQDDITVLRVKDYIKNPNYNGYRSLHLDLSIPVFLSEHTEHVTVEVQIRTVAMDFWASLEHDLRYKSDKEIPPEICEAMLESAAAIADIDVRMQEIFKQIQKLD